MSLFNSIRADQKKSRKFRWWDVAELNGEHGVAYKGIAYCLFHLPLISIYSHHRLGISQSLKRISELGAFDVLIGHSQGAALALTLCAMNGCPDEARSLLARGIRPTIF